MECLLKHVNLYYTIFNHGMLIKTHVNLYYTIFNHGMLIKTHM